MERTLIKSGLLVIIMAFIIPMSVFAQHKSVNVIVQKDGRDSLVTTDFFSTMFDVENVGEMHKKLDSIFATLGRDLNKRIKVMAFNSDSLFKEFQFNHQFEFDGSVDSIFSMHKLSTNDKRIDEIIKNFQLGPDKRIMMFDENNIDTALHKNMNIEIITDSVTENGKTVLRKEIIIKSEGEDGPVIIRKFDGEEGKGLDEVLAYSNKKSIKSHGKHIIVEKGDKMFKGRGTSPEKRIVQEIQLADAELLVKGGISPKVITAPALHPKNIQVNVKVKEEFGKEIKTVGMSMTFDDNKGLQVKILDSMGRILFEETRKKFTGTYIKDIELNPAITPYYFIVVRGKKMFGRMLCD